MDNRLPYYMKYPMPQFYDDDRTDRRDYEYMKSVYPDTAKRLIPYVEEECDRMEYDGSFMFDEYPDQLQIRRVSRRVYYRLNKKEYEDDLMMQETNGRNWMEDFVTMMLLNEMYQRRCRRRDRRCNWMY